jgi:hypothetical protein
VPTLFNHKLTDALRSIAKGSSIVAVWPLPNSRGIRLRSLLASKRARVLDPPLVRTRSARRTRNVAVIGSGVGALSTVASIAVAVVAAGVAVQ